MIGRHTYFRKPPYIVNSKMNDRTVENREVKGKISSTPSGKHFSIFLGVVKNMSNLGYKGW